MRYSILSAVLLAVCVVAASPVASAAYLHHGYGCSLVSASNPYNGIPGSHYATQFTNKSGSSAYVMCPVICDSTMGGSFTLYTSSSITSCTLYGTSQNGGYQSFGSGTRTESGTSAQFDWATTACQQVGWALEIQCAIPNDGAVYFYVSN